MAKTHKLDWIILTMCVALVIAVPGPWRWGILGATLGEFYSVGKRRGRAKSIAAEPSIKAER